MFEGTFVAIVTPFKNNKVDYDAYEKLLEMQIKAGNGIVPCGTTGESATLSYEEHSEVIKFTVDIVKKRVPVIAGTGSNSTKEALELTKEAEKIGADAALLISPYYNKPNQKGIYEHYKYIAENVNIPMILYNVPGRTARNIEAETTIALSKIKNIVGIKEASGDLVQASKIIKETDKSFVVLSGEDALTYFIMTIGGKGVISVTANVMPEKVNQMVSYALKGNFEEAKKLHLELLELSKVMFIDTNPIPVKETLALMGLISNELRLPLTNLSDDNREKLKKVLKSYNII
ncbi:MAG TPA: 4-hydroxy-tetrahydrodipicolinate synthase [Spirochaetota bacterium]|nr:4-hydroxy-tetrahydrodipicolinate synthase [Spirochaetota bacterium]